MSSVSRLATNVVGTSAPATLLCPSDEVLSQQCFQVTEDTESVEISFAKQSTIVGNETDLITCRLKVRVSSERELCVYARHKNTATAFAMAVESFLSKTQFKEERVSLAASGGVQCQQ